MGTAARGSLRCWLCRSESSAYLQDGAALRLALHVLAGLEHAQGDAVQEDDQHADVLEPGEGRALRRAHGASGGSGKGGVRAPHNLQAPNPSLLTQTEKKTPPNIPDLLKFEVFGN